jgi:hypothetical protein
MNNRDHLNPEVNRNKPSLLERLGLLDKAPDDALIGVREYCALLNCSRVTLHRRVKEGAISAPVKFGQQNRWTVKSARQKLKEIAGEDA